MWGSPSSAGDGPGEEVVATSAFIESLTGRLRLEYMNENWLLLLEDARHEVEVWRQEYNNERPHGALGQMAPARLASVTLIGAEAAG